MNQSISDFCREVALNTETTKMEATFAFLKMNAPVLLSAGVGFLIGFMLTSLLGAMFLSGRKMKFNMVIFIFAFIVGVIFGALGMYIGGNYIMNTI